MALMTHCACGGFGMQSKEAHAAQRAAVASLAALIGTRMRRAWMSARVANAASMDCASFARRSHSTPSASVNM